jgi:hypothetical protein
MRLSADRPRIIAEPPSRFFASDGKIGLLYGSAPLTRFALYSITVAAVARHDVWVLDGGNSFDAYFVARLARQWHHAPESILARIHLSRAFTCYQMNELITRRLSTAIRPFPPATIVCLGFLETFCDEDVPMADAVRLLKSVLARLTELAHQGHTIFVTTREPQSHAMHPNTARPNERIVLMNLLRAAATHSRRVAIVAPHTTAAPTQLALIAA